MDLRLPDALEMALRSNLDITIEKLNVEATRQRLVSALGFFDPVASFTTDRSSIHNVSPQLAPIGSFRPITEVGGSDFNPSLSANLFTGGMVTASLSASRSYTASSSLNLNPTFGSTFRIDFAQPLLRGAMAGSNGVHQIRIAAYDTRIERETFRQRVIAVVQQVLSGYYELQFAIENYDTKRSSRNLAEIQLENTRLRVQSGMLAGSALTAARAELAQREQDWIQSEVQIVLLQNALRALLSADRASSVWISAMLPVTQPDTRDPAMTLEEALASARAHRPELEIAQLQREQNLLNVRFAANQRLPQVNLTGSLNSPGASAVIVQPRPEDVDPAALAYVGGYGSTLSQSLGFNAPGWSAGINVQFPLRNRTLEAQYAQSRIADRRFEAQQKSTRLSVETNVLNVWESLLIQKNSMRAARLAREATEAQVEAITARFDASLATNFEVLSYQRDLANSRVLELRATIDYQQALINLLTASGVLLETEGIVLPVVR
jgi:outer membrane protein TolC